MTEEQNEKPILPDGQNDPAYQIADAMSHLVASALLWEMLRRAVLDAMKDRDLPDVDALRKISHDIAVNRIQMLSPVNLMHARDIAVVCENAVQEAWVRVEGGETP